MVKKITDAERSNVCITGLNDVPGLSTREMQQRFDGLGNLAISRLNELIDVVNNGEMGTTIINPENDKEFLNINQAFTLIRKEIADLKVETEKAISDLQKALDNKIVSVAALPAEPVEGTIYIIQGEVTVE